MAGGGNESPRQRMIGMMYLVLTALLALQVQNEVLEKFYFIDDSLQSAKTIAMSTNDKIIESMKKQVAEKGNDARDKAVLTKADKVKQETVKMIEYIQAIRTKIITAMGDKDPETGAYPKGDKYDEINTIMLGINEDLESGEAAKLQTTMNAYVEGIIKLDDSLANPLKEAGLYPLAPEKKDTPRYQGAKYDRMEWEHINFQSTPMVASLAVLSQLENDVVKVETKAIEYLKTKIGDFVIEFDKVQAMASAESNTVASGTKYTAKMFISATSTSLVPKMSSTKGGVKIDSEGVGTVEFTASGGSPEGTKQTWQGTITIKTASGMDTALTVKQEYTVVSPIIEIESGTVNSLYLKCGNELKVKVPALGVEYNPTFTATGGQAIKGSGASVTLVPNSAKMALSVSSGGNKIGTKNFSVKMIPKPTIKAKGLNLKQGGACPRSITLNAVPDASFLDQLPRDARYRVSGFTVTLARGKRVIGTAKSNGPTANLASIGSKAKPGDRLVIEVKGVQRRNFQNKTENVTISAEAGLITYPIN
ncbi:gliding motility-associated protein GldM [Bernardetia litoralis DSM 6794]|uniref:Gliding motility-associated protein GldM n=1 Tax=Bernardetia litoralis (strain ATCC 23117 / DSM 6794 / NBRC 15988 / NCIMB 1366 / Fx l1 / Sio-4) TaxID=880071 RepID=I4ALX5_BERLS|nr:gliding motility protein GldM [Bernardetia litoralis]AFM04960.1 gliding motility-associated protein GldM [Bernardetia litoralis DSM 6794]